MSKITEDYDTVPKANWMLIVAISVMVIGVMIITAFVTSSISSMKQKEQVEQQRMDRQHKETIKSIEDGTDDIIRKSRSMK